MGKKITRKLYAILALVLVVSLSGTAIYFNVFSKADKNDIATGEGETDYDSIERDTSISVDSSGVLQIERKEKEQVCMGEENTWTLFMYMTGSNLESQYENATKDIDEMFRGRINADNMSKVNIIIQTGGSTVWHSNNISNKCVQRYKVDIEKNSLILLEECGNENMGDASTLYDFLDWGVSNYPAEHMGVVFWDHGSGVSAGVCNDEKFKNDSLSVHELEYAFAKVNKKMTSKFEMIGFDTCLSGSLEYANLLAPYGKYMVASADLEPGEGWYYTPVVDSLIANPDITGDELGKVICENYGLYYNIMYNGVREIDYTLATYDLSKAAKVCVETNYLAKYLYDKVTSNADEYWNQEGFKRGCLSYNKSNLDMGSILAYFDASSQYNYNTTYFRQALNEMIICSKISQRYTEKQAMGITLYLPSSILNIRDLNNYRNVCFSPYLLNYVEWMNTRNITDDMSRFKTNAWEKSDYFFEKTFDFMNYDIDSALKVNVNDEAKKILDNNAAYVSAGFVNNWYDNVSSYNSYIPFFGSAPYEMMRNVSVTLEKNETVAKIPKEELHTINAVYNTVFTKINNELVCLGQNNKVDFNKETGEVKSNFECEWFMLPDGQLLTAYIVEQEDNTTVYAFPVLVGDEESSIRVKEKVNSKGEASYEVLGVWDFTGNANANDNFARGYLPLKSGTVITPIYDVFDVEAETYETEYGEEYTISGEFEFYFTKLDEGEYSFAYEIEKLNQLSAYTDLVDFDVKQ